MTQRVMKARPPVERFRGAARDDVRDDAETIDIRNDARKSHDRPILATERSGIRDQPADEQMSDGIHTRPDRRKPDGT